MTAVDILKGLEADGILTIVSTEFATDEGLFEIKHGMIRLVELRGPARQFNKLAGVLLRLLSSYQDKAWTDEGGHEGLDHSLSDSFGRMAGMIGERFHPISISQRAMRIRNEATS